jgi:hypothetical protein
MNYLGVKPVRTTSDGIYIIRENRSLMTVHHKKAQYLVGFRKYEDAYKVMFELDTRSNMYITDIASDHTAKLLIKRKQFVQFGKLMIDPIDKSMFLNYLQRPNTRLLLVTECEMKRSDSYVRCDCVLSDIDY